MLWLETKLIESMVWLVLFSGAGWVLTLAYKGASGEPVVYAYRYPLSGETIALGCLALSLLLLFLYGAIGFVLSRDRVRFRPSALIAPWVCALASLVLAGWVFVGPVRGASYLPLALMIILSGLIAYTARWGALRDRERVRIGREMENVEAADVARTSRPRSTFASIYGNEAVKTRLKEAAQAITAPRKEHSRPRNGILLHGLPGNGKTAFAEALAGELGLPLVTLTYADIASQWVGEKSARVRTAFEQARRLQPCVLFIDEVNSFLESRDGRADGVKEDRDLVNAMLTLMVDIRQSRVILVAATNHMNTLDSAGVREGRFDFKVEITPPDLPARIGLLKRGLRENLPDVQVEDRVVQSVAERWNGFSVKRILAVTEELPSYVKAKGLKGVAFEDFMGALRQLQGQRGHVPENVKRLDELIFSESTREMLDLIAARMLDPEHTERHGGTLPTGVLFYGPPGTGKTAACKALAKEVGWAYLPSTGADLARDPKRLEALYAKAQDLRPTIIFIDEPDELLRDRQFSGSTEATNKLLTLMDGVGDRVRDVVWIAATNNPDQIDPALLRGGRFTEKVVFELPSAHDLSRYVEQWLERKKIALDAGIGLDRIAEVVGHSSIANAEAILQSAVNRAIARRQSPVMVRLEDFERASSLVNGFN
ncbi:ATP-binding protein [Ramlibacter sp. AN1133]|uniref:ATP-binding protein n=1 Tax=Ramlibacter sp. AN1133 TaxID=3133429 RepID=UPI0030BCB4C4